MQLDCIKRVLVADDNADAGDTLGAFLELLGLEVIIVRDGLAAVSEAALRMPDVMILDLGMPVLDGWTACAQIRKLPSGEKVRILALSAWGSEDVRQRCFDVGFDGHVTKPADATMLLTMLSANQDSRGYFRRESPPSAGSHSS